LCAQDASLPKRSTTTYIKFYSPRKNQTKPIKEEVQYRAKCSVDGDQQTHANVHLMGILVSQDRDKKE
jgi:hypothetical protein